MCTKLKKKRARRYAWLNYYKMKRGCEECGFAKHPKVLEFAHIIPRSISGRKKISHDINSSVKKLMDNVRACRVLCRNCHALESLRDNHMEGNETTMDIIIDGDILAFRAAAMNPDNTEEACLAVKSLVTDMVEELFGDPDNVTMYVGGSGNFRKHYSDYKASRNPKEKPQTLQAVKDYLCMVFDAEIAEDCEADDMCLIAAQKARDSGKDFIIITSDKDLRQLPGKFYDPRTRTIQVVSEEQGYRWYLEQLLKGDPTDSIQGLRGIGDKKAKAWLEDNGWNEQSVSKMYQEHEGDDWQMALKKCWNLIYIRRYDYELGIQDLPAEFL